MVKNSVCAECNNGFSKFEQPVARELAPFRHLLLIPDRYGEVPEVVAKAEVQGKEQDAKVLREGKVQLKPIVTVINREDGSKEILYQHVTEQQKEKIRREAKEKGFELIESQDDAGEQAEVSVSGDLKVIGSPEGLRAGRQDKHRIDAIVRLFGGLCYFVVVSDHYPGADFNDSLVYDAQRGEVNQVLFVNEQAEFLQTEDVGTSEATIWGDLVASGKWFLNFLDHEIQSKTKR